MAKDSSVTVVVMLNLPRQAAETLEELRNASRTVTDTTEFAAVCLVAVLGVSVLALLLSAVAISRASHE